MQTNQSEHWNAHWREQFLSGTEAGSHGPWDLVVVGGGITGAGIFREAARRGLKVLLIEQRDFAWGTSSRSSKMVHGGLRYLAAGDFALARESVRERERLLKEAPGLVEPLPFLYPHYRRAFPPPWLFNIVLTIYDLMAGRWNHRYQRKRELMLLAPALKPEGLRGAMQFGDAVTDDARLVLRVLREGMHDGGAALNYVAARELLRDASGQVNGIRVEDVESGRMLELSARVVINATGAWADRLRTQAGQAPAIRPLRGSHLVVPFWRAPLGFTVSFRHPEDGRPVFAFPWEGVIVIGTTDLDHADDLDVEASISDQEVEYLLQAVNHQLPEFSLVRSDILSTWAGVRPVVASGAGTDPSREKREHSIWQDQGLITVSGGKLTTFRVIAEQVLFEAAQRVPAWASTVPEHPQPVFGPVPESHYPVWMPAQSLARMKGRYGPDFPAYCNSVVRDEVSRVDGSVCWWPELRWAARSELVVHLDDLLLRRTRIGMLLPNGAVDHLEDIGRICREELGWDQSRWESERDAYLQCWNRHYSPPRARGEA